MQPPVYVHKNLRHGAYTSVPNQAIQNQSLSWAARGLLAYMLTMPGDWQLNEKDLIGRAPTGRDHLRSIVRELEATGHLTRTPIRGRDGKLFRMVWEVWDLPATDQPSTVQPLTENPSVVQPLTGKPATENPSVDKTQSAPAIFSPDLQSVHATTDGLTVDGKPVRLQKKHLTKENQEKSNTPLPPSTVSATATRKQPFKPTATDVPPELQAVTTELLDFWAEKRGARSTRAWSGLLTELTKIAQDMHGGVETVRTQLNAAVQSGWQSVTYANWQRYAKPAAKPFGNSTGSRYASRAERQSEAVEDVVAFLDAYEPAHAAPPLTLF
jgi:hypothetical protein